MRQNKEVPYINNISLQKRRSKQQKRTNMEQNVIHNDFLKLKKRIKSILIYQKY